MSYHVNPGTGKVSVCRAKIKCRFGGVDGTENHYDSKQEANAAAELVMAELHADTNRLKEPLRKAVPVRTEFEASKKRIRESLAKAGVDVDLPDVRTEKELIAKWFNGDTEKYKVIARIADPNDSLQSETKKSVSGFVKRGAAVGFVTDIDALNKVKRKKPTELEQSEVDIMDDGFEKIDPRSLATGNLVAFRK